MELSKLYRDIEERSTKAMLSLWAAADNPMRTSFENLLNEEHVLGEPVVESAFPWKKYNNANWTNLFDPQALQGLQSVRRFEPFTHQYESWNYLHNNESVVVTSGTGSGKTECFLYPVLNDIASSNRHGVQAIFLYPLNALMEDQKDRLGQYCDALNINFAVYNGNTVEHPEDIEHPSIFQHELQCRDDIRAQVPQILLSNPSMLEYILVRPKDQAFINASAGQLKWIIIDEAHSYSGSAAVELQYQIKRILDAFGITDIRNVNFVCTSATISGVNGAAKLKHFISKLTGQDEQYIHVIGGERVVPGLTAQQLTTTLGQHPLFQGRNVMNNIITLRSTLNKKGALPLKKVWMILNNNKFKNYDEQRVLEMLDVLCDTQINNSPILNLRLHLFYRGINGIYTCINPQCTSGNLTSMGSLTLNQTSQCLSCGAPVLELMQCKSCGTIFVRGQVDNATGEVRQIPNDNSDDNLWGMGIYDEDSNSNTVNTSGTWSEFEICKLCDDTSVQPGNGVVQRLYHFEMRNKKVLLLAGAGATDAETWVECRHGRNILCPSCANNSSRFKHFRINTAMINTIVGPVLLDQTKQGNYDWGKFIAFTDSRQQTAISAKSFNIDEERAYMRSKLIKEMVTRREQFKQNPQYGVNAMVVTLLENAQRDSMQEVQYQQAMAFIANANQPMSLRDVADVIYCPEMLAHMDEDYINTPVDYVTPYKEAMLRNLIARRTINDPNIENLGFITINYPGLANVSCPQCLQNIIPNASDDDWRDFLKICIDFEIRGRNHFQPLSENEKLFVRGTNMSRPIFETGHQLPQGATYTIATWPSVSTVNNGVAEVQNHLVVLLCAASGFYTSQDLQLHQMEIDTVLHQAWIDLTANVLTQVQNGSGFDAPSYYRDHRYRGAYYLDLSRNSTKANIVLTEEARLCPVTRRFVETTFMEFSPAIKGFLSQHNIDRYRCSNTIYSMPNITIQDMSNVDVWFNSNAEVQIFKNDGIWNDTYERLYEGMNKSIYISAEHSAQQDRVLLNQYKEEFVNNELNVLFCSTTMEMGVDIGDIEISVMETVPPTSANYLQRAGRAGRSGQSKALAFTICNSSSIGVRVFNDTMWPFTTDNEMQDVIESEKILQRHFNSYFFRQYICGALQGGLSVKTELEAFFEGDNPTICDQFISYLQATQTNAACGNQFAIVFPNQVYSQAITNAINRITVIRTDYLSVINAMTADYNQYSQLNDPASQRRAKAIRYQMAAFRLQNLLTYLAENQYLPDSNMPTSIIEFRHFNEMNYRYYLTLIDQYHQYCTAYQTAQTGIDKDNAIDNIKKTKKKIERLLKKVTSSRETKIGLNEYAPEQTVVIDEQNFVSAGVSLENEFGSMTLKRYLRECDMCHKIYYQPVTAMTTHCTCSPQSNLRTVLTAYRNIHPFALSYEVIGMESDIRADRKEQTEREYYTIGSLLTNLDWTNSINTINMMEITTNDGDGEIIYDNTGSGYGFAVCKQCGRAHVEGPADEVVTKFIHTANQKHFTLHGEECTAFRNANVDLDRHVVLTGRLQTDYCAFKFYDDAQTNVPTTDDTLIYSLGVILRKALAEELGIDEGEIDYGITKTDNTKALFIYDTNKGGSGYSKAFMDVLTCQRIFAKALQILKTAPCNCENSENGACSQCLIDHKSQHFINNLSKAKVMEWLIAQQKMNVILPANVSSYSNNAVMSYKDAITIANNSIVNTNVKEISFFVSDNGAFAPREWTSRNSVMGQLIEKLILNGKTVNIYFEYHPKANPSFEDVYFLSSLSGLFTNLDFRPISDMGVFKTLLIVHSITNTQRYFTDELKALPFNDQWGKNSYLYVDDTVPTFNSETLPTVNDLIALSQSTDYVLKDGVMPNLSLKLGSIVDTIFKIVGLNEKDEQRIDSILRNQDVEIEYSDNFLVSGVGCQMLFALIDKMKDRYNFDIKNIKLDLDGSECNNSYFNDNTYIYLRFANSSQRDSYIDKSIKDMFNIHPLIKGFKSVHYRWIQFKTNKGSVEVRPDGGIGRGWQTKRVNYKDIFNDFNIYDDNMILNLVDDDVLYYVKIS